MKVFALLVAGIVIVLVFIKSTEIAVEIIEAHHGRKMIPASETVPVYQEPITPLRWSNGQSASEAWP